MSAAVSRSPFRRAGWLFRRLLLLAILLLLLPYLLAPLYRVIDPVSTLMLWRWASGAKVERTVLPLAAMARPLPLSVLVAEDARFCSHGGIDWKEIREAVEDADDLSEARGGSTITQQLAKNLFLWPGRSFVRKAMEAPLALWIELVLPKRRILEIYLNVVEWGPDGQFGAEAGAQRAFGKSAQGVSAREAALMAAVLPNPRLRSASRPGPGVRRLAGIYEARTRSAGSVASCLRLGR